MKQAIVKKGKVFAENIPAPAVSDGSVLIKVAYSSISAGTEMSGVAKSKDTVIGKALNKSIAGKIAEQVASDGLTAVYDKVRKKLSKEKEAKEQGKTTGYSISGIVIEAGEGVRKFKPGDRVAAAGAGYASHAEFVSVPENLVMRVPEGLNLKYASTVTLGGIAMQGVRRADLKLGEYCVVFGAGILGLLTVQLLKLAGIRVITIDLEDRRLELAKQFGSELTINPRNGDPVRTVDHHSGGYGADAVIFTAATSASEPLSQSFQMCKRKGRVVMVGVSGMEIQRHDMYVKELDLILSTSYGPGRYDTRYEEKGLDYPYAYVRWTENRNMEEYLRLLNTGQIHLDTMIDDIYPVSEVTQAFDSLKDQDKKPLLVLLDYGPVDDITDITQRYQANERSVSFPKQPVSRDIINIGLIGAGNFATSVHIPNIIKLKDKYRLYAVSGQTGVRTKYIAEKHGAGYATTDYEKIIKDEAVDLVMICTQHNSHAKLVLTALESGKHVFVEKPLAINQQELDAIKSFYNAQNENDANVPLLMVGFNRRFSPYNRAIKKLTDTRVNPLQIRYRMNAGYLPPDHWVFGQGGRIIGEACHIIDLMTYFTGTKIKHIYSDAIVPENEKLLSEDNKTIVLQYEDGSLCSIDYFSAGNTGLAKEYMEIHFDGTSILMDDYQSIKSYGVSFETIKQPPSPKGHLDELIVLYDLLKKQGSAWPIPLWDMVQTTEVTFQV